MIIINCNWQIAFFAASSNNLLYVRYLLLWEVAVGCFFLFAYNHHDVSGGARDVGTSSGLLVVNYFCIIIIVVVFSSVFLCGYIDRLMGGVRKFNLIAWNRNHLSNFLS